MPEGLQGRALSANGAADALRNIIHAIQSGDTASACDELNLAAGFIGTVLGLAGAHQGYLAGKANGFGVPWAEDLIRGSARDSNKVVPRGGVCSFSADTLVATKDGETSIGDLAVGDEVLAYDETDGSVEAQPITAVHAHRDEVILHLTIDGEQIETTPEHPFYTQERGWVAAGELHVGEHILKADMNYGVVERLVFDAQPQMMYNLTVDEDHTFFVGDGQWLVHNNCDPLDQNLPAYQNGYGRATNTVSSLENKTFDEAFWELVEHPHVSEVRGPTPEGYARFIFDDGSEIWLEAQSGEVVRLPVRAYGPTGSGASSAGARINSGVRYDIYTQKLYWSQAWHNLPRIESLKNEGVRLGV